MRAEGRPVFVNATAAWCITGQVNDRIALRSAGVQDAFAAPGAAAPSVLPQLLTEGIVLKALGG